jgi:hypothetical protein
LRLFLLFVTFVIAPAYSFAGTGHVLLQGMNDVVWVCFVLTSFPRAMLIMAASFGLWRAGLISNGVFAACVAAVVIVLLGGTTWESAGFWAPDGVYSCAISPTVGLVWVALASMFLLGRPATRTGW